MTAEPQTSDFDAAAIRVRAIRLASGVGAPLATPASRAVLGFAASSAVGFMVGVAAHQPIVGAIVGLALCITVAAYAWAPFTRPGLRAATELYYDHNCHELAEWKADTGTSMPRGLRAVEKWLDAHPNSPDRVGLLLVLGRVDEADRAIAGMPSGTPEEAFEIELLRQTRSLLIGASPDLDRLRVALGLLRDPRDVRHRRECIALLEAQVVIANGGDPIATLAVARAEVGEVYWSMRFPWLIAKWSLLALSSLVLASLAAAIVLASIGG